MKGTIFGFIIGLAAAVQLTAYADTTDSISVSGSPEVGQTFSVTVSIRSDEEIDFMTSSLEYDETVIEFVSGDAVGGGGIITLHTFPDGDAASIECELTFTAVGEGDSFVMLSNGYVFSRDGVVLSQPSAYEMVHVEGAAVSEEQPAATEQPAVTAEDSGAGGPDDDITVSFSPDDDTPPKTEAQQSEESEPEEQEEQPVVQGYLTDLTCDAGLLEPKFAYNVFDYTVYADYSAETAQLTATAAAFSDIVSYSEGGALEVGDNIKTVTVTAEDGTVNVYTVNIIRLAPDESVVAADAKLGTSGKEAPPRDKYKDMLNPALAIVLVTLVVALAIVIMWVRSNLGKNKGRK